MEYLQQQSSPQTLNPQNSLQPLDSQYRLLLQSQSLQLFCYMYIRQLPQAYICIGFSILGLILIFYTIKQFKKSLALKKMNDIVKLTYISMVASVLIYLLKVLLSQIVFWIQWQSQWQESDVQEYLTISKYQFTTDCILNFLLRTTILLVPANWLKCICGAFNAIASLPSTPPQEKQKLEKSTRFEYKTRKIITKYFVARTVIFLVLLALFLAINQQRILNYIGMALLAFFQLQSTLVFIVLVFEVVFLKYNIKLKECLDEKDYNLMISNYLLLITVILIRLGSDLYFVVKQFSYIFLQTQCYVASKQDPIDISDIIVIINETLLTCYLSIVVILRIYKTQQDLQVNKNKDILQTIIDSQSVKAVEIYNTEVRDTGGDEEKNSSCQQGRN